MLVVWPYLLQWTQLVQRLENVRYSGEVRAEVCGVQGTAEWRVVGGEEPWDMCSPTEGPIIHSRAAMATLQLLGQGQSPVSTSGEWSRVVCQPTLVHGGKPLQAVVHAGSGLGHLGQGLTRDRASVTWGAGPH